MLGKFIGMLGGAIGKELGGGIFTSIGRYAGGLLGTYLENHFDKGNDFYRVKGNLLNDFYVHSYIYGNYIPQIYGKGRVAGSIIWARPLTEIAIESSEERGKNTHHITEFNYFATFAMAICAGEILSIERVWVGERLISLQDFNYRIYYGDEEQVPDELMIADFGEGKSPAHRGLAYIVFEELPLESFGNQIPNFSFEVNYTPLKLPKTNRIEDLLQSMIMIPGSGEFVYDTEIVSKYIQDEAGDKIFQNYINKNNTVNIADALYSLHQLRVTCPNLEWVAPVVCWFADDVNIAKADIYPAVEYNDRNIVTDPEWSVAGCLRRNAREISKNELGSPNYGGTVNDQSVLNYLDELRKSGLKIMFYPMIFIDTPGKPWRGFMTGRPEDIASFFNKPLGYNNFILHYAQLVKGRVDVFIIGSELKEITSISQGNGVFPAVKELVKLAAQVKDILGPDVQVSYAADWSEYHHTDGGWYHLDELWASPNIDFVGIDCYFPLTNNCSSNISREEIFDGWQSGEGYDYYFDDSRQKRPLGAAYAWKNMEYWWENQHINPNGSVTSWVPRLKPIWLTEIGFPSIDKCSNQPNVFYDPECINGGVPRYSTSEIDVAMQRDAIYSSVAFLSQSDFINNFFFWTWDARPYPAFPHHSIWADNSLWSRGHWLNGKLGFSHLGGIIDDVLQKAGLDSDEFNIDELELDVRGITIENDITIMEFLQLMRCGYFFDITPSENGLCFKIYSGDGSQTEDLVRISEAELLWQKNHHYQQSEYSNYDDFNSKIELSYIDFEENYLWQNNHSAEDYANSGKVFSVKFPVILSNSEINKIQSQLLLENQTDQYAVAFALDYQYSYLEIGDILELYIDDNQVNFVKITEICFMPTYIKFRAKLY